MRRIGCLGGGQLGMMLGQAATDLGVRLVCLDPGAEPPAARAAGHVRGGFADPQAAQRLAEAVDGLVTYEFEHLDLPTVASIPGEVLPPVAALATVQDRLRQKAFLRDLGLPTAPWAPLMHGTDLAAAAAAIPGRGVLKTARDGYDGKGQARLADGAGLPAAWESLGRKPCVLEGFVTFTRELSLVACRGRDGQCVFWPLAENEHRGGILFTSIAPAPGVDATTQHTAEAMARRLLEAFAYVGTFTIELFDTPNGLVVNEVAPRVHNSGHWTIEGSATSQFANHLRALLGLPLGDTAPRGACAMVNLVGGLPDPAALLAIPGANLHDYGKDPRPGRKVGHVTLVEPDAEALAPRLAAVQALAAAAWR